jgi:hypothetical protein
MYRYSDIVREIAANAAMSVPAIKDLRVRKGRTICTTPEMKAHLVIDQFNFFIEAIGWESIQGKVVAEIGPGDAIPLAPLFLAAGAKQYLAVDRFLGEIYGADALRLYEAVADVTPARLVDGLRHLYQKAGIRSLEELVKSPDLVNLYRVPIERPADSLRGKADYIVSFNVCEHLSDVPKALRGMRSILASSGVMIHRIDYGPHDLWLHSYRNPLAFLTIPRAVWRAMTSNRGCPNRIRHTELVAMVRDLGFDCTETIGRRASESDILEARPYFSSEFRAIGDDDISVLDAEVICRRQTTGIDHVISSREVVD